MDTKIVQDCQLKKKKKKTHKKVWPGVAKHDGAQNITSRIKSLSRILYCLPFSPYFLIMGKMLIFEFLTDSSVSPHFSATIGLTLCLSMDNVTGKL